MFDKCCSVPSFIPYTHTHSPKPYSYSPAAEEAIKMLLLYMPNIDSMQSTELNDLNDALYDNFIFTYLLSFLGMNEENDVKWYGRNDIIPDDEWGFFRDNFCLNCQKIIICKIATETKTKNLLRSIRNAIAHGDFIVKDDMLLGFNTHNGHGKAIIKIKYSRLIKAIKSLVDTRSQSVVKEELFAFAFGNLGYSVTPSLLSGSHYDLALTKNGRAFYVELKTCRGQQYLHNAQVEKMLPAVVNLTENQYYVLIIDTSRITKEVDTLLQRYPKFRILDIRKIKELLSGIDALQSLVDGVSDTV